MNCDEARPLIGAYTDGESDPAWRDALAAHLRTCPECERRAAAARELRSELRAGLPRFDAPPELAGKIRAALRNEDKPERVPPTNIVRFSLRAAGIAAALGFMLIVGYRAGDSHARKETLVADVISGHVRSLQAEHLTDVVSTDRHTVRPWFAGKLDFSPPVANLAEVGFPLVGGRLDRIDGRTAAALVFRRRLHVVNLFILPAGESTDGIGRATRVGYNVLVWTGAGLDFVAVSDLSPDELDRFAEAFRAGTR